MLITIIIPIYNVEDFFEKCIKSLIHQTYRNIEIILVDDGSTDHSGAICDDYAKTDKRIKVIHKNNGGVSSARNIGIENSTGEYICFVDADDWCANDMLEFLVSIIGKNDISSCGYETVKSKMLDISHQDEKVEEITNLQAIEDMLYQKNIENGPCAKLYLRSAVSNIRFPENIKIGEDFVFNYNIMKNIKSVSYSNTKKYFYYQRDGSAMKSKFVPKRMDAIVVSKAMLNDIQNSFPTLIRAGKRRLFVAAIRTILTMDKKDIKKEYSRYYQECKTILRNNAPATLFNPKTNSIDKLLALIVLINPSLIIYIRNLKRLIKEKYKING